KEKFIAADGRARTPNAITSSGHGTFYVSSIFNGNISEYDGQGHFVREILRPPSPALGPRPYVTGTPLGLGVDASGTLYYADLALVFDPTNGIGPAPHLGTVRRIRFANGTPQAPETIDSGLNFPDGIGILEE